MSLSLSIRSATTGDAPAVVALWRSCGLVASYNDPVADFLFALGKPSSDVLLGVDGEGRICGSVLVGHDGHRGWVWYVAAHPDQRKQNVGRRMVEAGETWLKERGIPKVMLMVRDTNAQVVDFYKHIGYQLKPNIVLEKWLTKPPEV